MTIRAKVVGCLLAILFLFVSVNAYIYSKATHAARRLMLVNEVYLPLSRKVIEIQGDLHNLISGIRYASASTPDQTKGLVYRLKELYPQFIRKKLSDIDQLLKIHGNKDEQIAEIRKSFQGVTGSFEALIQSEPAHMEGLVEELKTHFKRLAAGVDEECQSITQMAQRETTQNLISYALLSTVALLLGGLAVLLSHRALLPLPQLIESIGKIADGDFHQSLKVNRSEDEIGLLARTFNKMLGALRDRDERIRSQQKELLQAERLAAVGQLSAEVVHEIRNPLNSISLNIDWLAVTCPNDPETQKTLTSIAREIQRLNQITESYLVRARIPKDELKKVNLNELLQEMIYFDQEEDRHRKILVSSDLAGEDLYVKVDRSRLRQALINVLKNARESMPNGGYLNVRSGKKGNVVEVQVTDTGFGMNETTRRNMFQPFFTTKAAGTGLGLLLTKNIIEEAHGSIRCESEVGRGTIFTFQFPV